MREMTCITCPNSCLLYVEQKEGKIIVTGNKCKRGEAFAAAELTHPMRTISSTVRTVYKDIPVLPVRVSEEIPKEKIFDVMKEINKVTIDHPVDIGDVIIPHVLGLSADVIAISDIQEDLIKKGAISRIKILNRNGSRSLHLRTVTDLYSAGVIRNLLNIRKSHYTR